MALNINLYFKKFIYFMQQDNYTECLNILHDNYNNIISYYKNNKQIDEFMLLALEAHCLYKLEVFDSYINVIDMIIQSTTFNSIIELSEDKKELIGMKLIEAFVYLVIMKNNYRSYSDTIDYKVDDIYKAKQYLDKIQMFVDNDRIKFAIETILTYIKTKNNEFEIEFQKTKKLTLDIDIRNTDETAAMLSPLSLFNDKISTMYIKYI